jgi:long-chain acyl-CoA synthetase
MRVIPDRAQIEKIWLKHYDAGVPPTLEYSSVPLPDLIAQSCEKHARRTAVVFLGKKLSYADIDTSASAFAQYLTTQGITKGDRVLLMLPNCPQFVIAYYAILKCGGVVVPASPLDTATELEFKYQNSGAKLLVFLDLLFEKVESLLTNHPSLPAVAADVADYLPWTKKLLFLMKKKTLRQPLPDFKRAELVRFRQVIRRYSGERAPAQPSICPDDPAVIIYTGGTTGVSKGVVLSHRALVVNMTQARIWGDISDRDIGLCALPFFHGFGLSVGLNLSLTSGGKMVLMPRWNEAQAIRHFEKDGITVFAGVPTMYNAILQHAGFARMKKAALRGCFVGAAPVPESLKQAFANKTGGTLIEGYGLTEAVTAKCANPYRGLKKEKSIGIPWPDTVMAIVDENTGALLPPGEAGEIILHSPDLMTGYWQNPEATAETLRDGWLYTGDIGKMDADGYFSILDRKKDLIISGGYNVYPTEIEELLYRHPAVFEASVIGVADAHLGEVARAFIVTRPGMSLSPEDLQSYLAERLVKYKIPKTFIFKDELPKSPIGKILKKELRRTAR